MLVVTQENTEFNSINNCISVKKWKSIAHPKMNINLAVICFYRHTGVTYYENLC